MKKMLLLLLTTLVAGSALAQTNPIKLFQQVPFYIYDNGTPYQYQQAIDDDYRVLVSFYGVYKREVPSSTAVKMTIQCGDDQAPVTISAPGALGCTMHGNKTLLIKFAEDNPGVSVRGTIQPEQVNS